MANVVINGQNLITNDLAPVDSIILDLSDPLGVPSGNSVQVYDSAGPNNGSNLASVVINSWTNTLIDFDYDTTEAGYPSEYVHNVRAYDSAFNSLTLFDVDPAQLQTPLPLLDGASSYGTWYNINDPGGNWSVANSPTAEATPGMFLYTNGAFVTGGGDGVRIIGDSITTGAPVQLDFVFSIDPIPFFNTAPSEGYFVLRDQTLRDLTVNQIVPLDSAGIPLEAAQSDYENFVEATTGQLIADPTTIVVDFSTNGSPTQPNSICVHFDNLDSVCYYDPLGPGAGFNPGSETIVQWDQDAIEITDATLITGNAVRVSVVDISGRQIFAEMDYPIPAI